MKFKSGMLGVCIVVLALLGTILGGFILGIDSNTRDVTSYDYVTDVTGLFDISETPEYVAYSPSSNLVGYTPNTVNYVPSSTVNAYRYIANEGAIDTSTYTVDHSGDYPLVTDRFRQSEVGGQIFINWTGSYNFGNTIQFQGITYNAATPAAQYDDPETETVDVIPKVTSLYSVISAMGITGYKTASVDISYGTYPVLFYYGTWTFTDVQRGDGLSQYLYSATLNESNTMPTHLDINLVTNSVAAYRNDTLMWNVNADQVDVIYTYSTRASGTFSSADSSATFTTTSIGYPTYSYMDPTKGITMDVSDYSVEYTLPADASSDYDLATSLPKTSGAMNSFAYIYNYNGWGDWTGSVTMNSYQLQAIVPNTIVNPSLPTMNPNIQSFKAGIVNNFGLNVYSEYEIYFTHSNYPIYMERMGVNNVPLNFVNTGNYLDSQANQLQTIYYLETGYTPIITKAVYDPLTDVVTAYSGSSPYTLEWTADADDIWMITDYYLLDSSLQSVSPTSNSYYVNRAPVNTTVHITADRDAVTTWSNGYQNDEITMSIQRYNLLGNDLTITAGTSYVTLSTNTSGYMTANVNGDVTNIGLWRNIQLSISAVNGTLSITPLSSISFTAASSTNNATIVFEDWYSGSPIEQLQFSTTGQSLRWQITQTTVFLDTFNAVMYNPTITIGDYFPDIGDWRLNFYSFAIYGDGFTINNVPFTVNRANATVTFTLDDKTYTNTLQNIYITNQNENGTDHMYLTFQNNKTVYDLGDTVTETISFTGLWYFTTGLYKAVTVTESYYDWQLDGLWHITNEQTIVIFLGLLGLGLIVLKGMFGVSIKSLDGIIIIFAGAIGLLIVI